MAINRDYLGRAYELPEPYEVTRVKIREFADAISDPNPLYRDPAHAKEAGYTDVIAPPTFPIILSMEGAGQLSPTLNWPWTSPGWSTGTSGSATAAPSRPGTW